MQSMKKSGALRSEDSMERHRISCSPTDCSLYRIRRSQSVSEVHEDEDVLNTTPRLSHHGSHIRVDRRSHDQNSLSIPEKASQSSLWMASDRVQLPKSAAELINEISTLEREVMHLEHYLLSLYRSAFDQYLANSLTSSTQASRSPNIILIEHQASRLSNSFDRSHHANRNEIKRDINFGHFEDSSMASSSLTNSGPSPREYPKYDEPKSMSNHRSLADHLGASIADHVPQTPSKLSEDIIKCICAIYCKLATSPTQQMELLASPTPSASSSSTFSPQEACDSWSPRCHYEASTSPCSFDSPKNKESLYSGMIEVPKISIDGDKFGYASKMLNIFRSLIRRLGKISPEKMDHEEQLAFWINIHNALVMHAFLAYGLHENQMKSNFSILKAAYDIGGHSVNAYDIQGSILGCQLHRHAQGIRNLLSPAIGFKKGKGKHPFALKQHEPLAHFALSLGTYSDPAVRVYTTKGIYQELKLAKNEFVQAHVWVQKESKIIMPKILCYYSKDASLELSAIVEMVSECVAENLRKSIKRCLLRKKPDKCIEWSPYKSSFRYLVHRDLANL